MRLLGNRLLVRPLRKLRSPSGRIHYTEQYFDDEKQWQVEAVGPRVKDLAAGDRILYDPRDGNEHCFEDGRRIIKAALAQLRWRWVDGPDLPEIRFG